jgi:glycogen debranching enzyme
MNLDHQEEEVTRGATSVVSSAAYCVSDDAALAADLRKKAADLQTRLDRDFWMQERRFYALALDEEDRPVGSLTSNAGHLLWSGIVSGDRARLVAHRLMGEEFFSGWGIRTMAMGEEGYVPTRARGAWS